MQTYLVGGAVRDELLGIDVKDRDWVVVGATPDEMLAKGFKQVGADFPVFLHPKTREEYALARTERKQGRGYHGFSVYSAPDVTLEEDLKRRDLTINAMARDEQGELVDPFHGLEDLRSRQLRHVSPAFAEDPLRILRTARFAARFQPMGFKVHPDTMALMRQMVAEGEVDHLVPERVWQEVQRALHEQEPGTFFEVLRDCGALPVLIPELADDDTLAMALSALRSVARHDTSTGQRFAALLLPLSAEQAITRAEAMKAPNDCRDLARLACHFKTGLADLSSSKDATASALLELLDYADLWRRETRFEALLQVLDYALPEDLRAGVHALQIAARAAAGVNPRELLARGFKGKAMGEAIRAERLKRIEQALPASNS
ncbi:multifunctional CCA tRNA nucleotidyl transferase/2'3'-cyclic phosphodiesterase/2'nucleotidase/phosphatase [Marinobacter pelagius]|uniref:CCA-adding enzyme n=1 Tax=Marinobacter pelagius TaxID=379482 RepID=A0A1I5A250_9GAMM|nr:multifunctional CCA tRNA nucleotidyl transferase/2'3'-cyclic phosphodiesterase/2'nucleotidase/phosphatase [Marinobacter pelagius]SFN56564.1 tRNA nucleotidyltransferase (CCA-adding enzyme) [Marinobacter pelagius]